MEEITYEEWKRLKLTVGRITAVQRVKKTEKLYKLEVDIGAEAPIQIVTSLVPYYAESELQGKSIVVLRNLKPTKFAGELSQGMLLCAETADAEQCVLLTVEKDIEPGTPVT